MKKLFSFLLLCGTLIFATSCSNEGTETPQESKANNLELIQFLAQVSSNTGNTAKSGNAKSKGSARDQPPIWADCIVYSGLVVPATFKPSSGNFDELYIMPEAMFYDGLPLISDSKPGDQDYNGGRWHLNILKTGVDASKYNEACNVEALDINDFESTDMYFECPMRPRR